MGRKEKHRRKMRNINKNKNAQNATGRGITAVATTAPTTAATCFHGSNKEAFESDSEYLRVLDGFRYRYLKRDHQSINNEFSACCQDPGFIRFIFANCVNDYLTNGIGSVVEFMAWNAINGRYRWIPKQLGKDAGIGSDN